MKTRGWWGRGCGAIAFVGVLVGGTAIARAADDADVEALVHQGVELRKQGHNDLALPLLERAYYTAPSGRTAAQLGLVRLALDQWVEAEALLEKSLALGGSWIEKYRSVLEDSIQQARSHIGRLLVKGTPPGASVVVDGATVGALPMASPVELAEGRRRLLVRASGFTDFAEEVVVVGKESQVLEVRLEAPAPASGSSVERVEPAASASREGRSVWPWVTAGGAAAALAFGIVEHVRWNHGVSDFDAVRVPGPGGQLEPACAEDAPMRGQSGSCSGIYDRYSSARTLAFVGYGAAAAFAVTSVILFLREPSVPERGRIEASRVCGPDIVHRGWQCVVHF